MAISLLGATLITCLTGLILFVIHAFIVKPYQIFRTLTNQGIPGDPFIPFLGQMVEFGQTFRKNPSLFFAKRVQKHGDTFAFALGPIVRLWSMDADFIQSLLVPNQKVLHKPSIGRRLISFMVGPENLLISNGSYHQQQRKTLRPVFNYDNLKSMISLMSDCTQTTIQNLDKMLEGKDFIEIDVHRQLSDLTLNIIAASVFGNAFSDRSVSDTVYQTHGEARGRLIQMIGSARHNLPIIQDLPSKEKTSLQAVCAKFETVVQKIITERKEGKSKSMCKGADLLDLLLKAKETSDIWTDELISAQTRTFILAGHETTSNLLTWTLHVLTNLHPELWRNIQTEVDEVCKGEIPTPEHLNELKFLDAVFHESLRLFPPVWTVGRQLMDDVVISPNGKSLFLPKGTEVFVPIYFLHRSEKYWPEPEKFDPVRWTTKQARHPYAFLPFGAGQRMCIGNQFALLEAKVIMAMLFQKYEMDAVPGQDMSPEVFATARPRNGLLVKLRHRKL